MDKNPLPRLDKTGELYQRLLPLCRLRPGDVWRDPRGIHTVACVDAVDVSAVGALFDSAKASLAIHDPPYNLVAFKERTVAEYLDWCRKWIEVSSRNMVDDSALYIWLGADQKNDFQPLPDFMILMREFSEFRSKSFITMRNQRGYGTQGNWMAIRQELLYYAKGNPHFNVQYTDIPRILQGYYKEMNGQKLDNDERSKSRFIRAGNVWVDIQQVFYRMDENVSGCYAQKPLKAIERIIEASSSEGGIVLDLFAHSGTTLLACDRLGRRCITTDIDPLFCEITIRRLERFRETGHTGWQNGHPFEEDISVDE
ncbi:MAG: DNA-methyltransferase [Armatimonadota bacterium]